MFRKQDGPENPCHQSVLCATFNPEVPSRPLPGRKGAVCLCPCPPLSQAELSSRGLLVQLYSHACLTMHAPKPLCKVGIAACLGLQFVSHTERRKNSQARTLLPIGVLTIVR